MAKDLFESVDYKQYLIDVLTSNTLGGRGARTTLAQAAGCQLAFISQVLNGNADFSLEQADGISRYLSQNSKERDYFLLLVQYARAGTESLRAHFMRQIKERNTEARRLADRFRSRINQSHQARGSGDLLAPGNMPRFIF